MPSSGEHLRRLSERRRHDVPQRRRGLIVVVVGLLVVFAAGAAAWRLVPAAVPGAAATGGGPVRSLSARVAALWLQIDRDRLAPPSSDATPATFTIEPGEGLRVVAERLAAEGFVRDADAFRRLAQVRGLDREVKAGTSTLRRDMPAEEVLNALLVGRGASVRVTIPEGWRAEQVADRLANAGVADRSEFLRLVREGAADGAAADRPRGTGLEGYLFPDTYDFEPGAGAGAVIGKMLDNFDARVSPLVRTQAPADPMPLYEAVTLASIVEREATVASERPRIARVFLNRLAVPPYLINADPTVQYAIGYEAETGSWWKTGLTAEDLEIDSAYNTYEQPGLPPGPIANPGLASIEAVLQPEAGDWLYFVLDGERCDGSHVFAATWDEHLANVARYRASGCLR